MSQGVVKNKQKSKRGWRRGRCQEKLILTVQGSWCRLTRSLYHPHFRLGQTQFQTPPTSPLPHWGFFPSFPSDGVCVYNMYPLFCHPHQCLSQEDVISSRFFHSSVPCPTERLLSMSSSGYLLQSRHETFQLVMQWLLSNSESLFCARHCYK